MIVQAGVHTFIRGITRSMPKRSHVSGKQFSKTHSTVTEATGEVIRVLEKLPSVKRIATGEIRQSTTKGGARYLTLVYTNAGIEMIITGGSVQKITVFTDTPDHVLSELKSSKRLKNYTISQRERKPGV